MEAIARVCCVLIFAAAGFWVAVDGEDFHPNRTRLMDVHPESAPENFLFRGNMPVMNGSFAYKEITDKMKSIIKDAGFTAPTNFSLIVVSYLNPFEEKDLEIERKFFQRNQGLGKLDNIIVTGCLTAPPNQNTTLNKDIIKYYVLDFSIDDLPRLTKHLHDLLQQSGPSTLVYTHCEAGTDRTGEVSGAYYMRYLNDSFSKALYKDNHIQNRDMYKTSRNAMQWYCYYLQYFEGFDHLNCTLPTT